MDRTQKLAFVTQLHTIFLEASVVVAACYSGLSAAEMTALRVRMAEAGGGVKVIKNRLTQRALEGTKLLHMANLLNGPVVIGYSDDPLIAPRVFSSFSKEKEKLVILGGALGAVSLNPEGVKALATMPSLDVLRAKILAVLVTPARRVAQVTAAPAAQLARVFDAYARKDSVA